MDAGLSPAEQVADQRAARLILRNQKIAAAQSDHSGGPNRVLCPLDIPSVLGTGCPPPEASRDRRVGPDRMTNRLKRSEQRLQSGAGVARAGAALALSAL